MAVDAPVWRGWAPHPVMQRFVAFAGLLGDRPGVALACDVRDVIFQAPPFEPAPQGLEAFVEADGPLVDHAFNMKYLRALVRSGSGGPDGGQVVSVRGYAGRAARGGIAPVAVDFDAGVRAAFRRSAGRSAPIRRPSTWRSIRAWSRRRCAATTAGWRPLGLTPGERLRFEDGQVVNPDGGISPIVHQHDRHPHLDAPVHARWGAGLEHRKRVRPKSAGQKLEKLKASLRRRMPELR